MTPTETTGAQPVAADGAPVVDASSAQTPAAEVVTSQPDTAAPTSETVTEVVPAAAETATEAVPAAAETVTEVVPAAAEATPAPTTPLEQVLITRKSIESSLVSKGATSPQAVIAGKQKNEFQSLFNEIIAANSQ